MRDISRQILARDAAWTLADGSCKELTLSWARWENAYLAASTVEDRARIFLTPAAVCDECPIVTECADLAELSGYTGIAGGRPYRNGRLDTYRAPDPLKTRRRTA